MYCNSKAAKVDTMFFETLLFDINVSEVVERTNCVKQIFADAVNAQAMPQMSSDQLVAYNNFFCMKFLTN